MVNFKEFQDDQKINNNPFLHPLNVHFETVLLLFQNNYSFWCIRREIGAKGYFINSHFKLFNL